MKIYASSRDNSLDRFVGKDVWVKADIYNFNVGYTTYYVKVLEANQFAYYVYMLPTHMVDDGHVYFNDEQFYSCLFAESFYTSDWVRKQEISIAKPFELLSGDEIRDMVDNGER